MTDQPSPQSDLRYSGLAVTSLILGVLSPLWLVFGLAWGIFGFLAVFAGRRARKEIDLAPYKLEGRALAIGGIVTGAIGFTTALFLLIIVLTSPPV
ncbi:MAG: DUF4190 domain-containing protein [Acidimicrobiia bacterium]|nr:DUF4190 domain-containing protein [Acidimicrobiia bacterium]